MIEIVETLEYLVLDHVPRGFFEQLATRQTALYAEADEVALHNPSWQEPEGEMVIPLVRRALFEHELRLAAAKFRLTHSDLRHAGDNCGYGLVRAGKLAISIHHVGGPYHFVRPCQSRKQNAAVNKFVDQLPLEGLMTEPLPELEKAGLVNGHLLHGTIREKRGKKILTHDFLQLAFPDAELSRYARNYSVRELLQKYAARQLQKHESISGMEDHAVPVLNRKKKKIPEIVN